jgi:hypothetical protein
MIFEIFHRQNIAYRLLSDETKDSLTRETLAVVYKEKRAFLVIFGPDDPQRTGAFVEISPPESPPESAPKEPFVWPKQAP